MQLFILLKFRFMLDVIKNRYIYIFTAWFFVLFSLFMILFGPKNLWIDMTGGTQSEYNYSGEINLDTILSGLEEKKDIFNQNNENIINGLSAYKVYGENKIIVEVGYNIIPSDIQLEKYKTDFNEITLEFLKQQNATMELFKYVNIGKSFWDYIKKTAIITLIIALFWIGIYIAFAFFWVAIWVWASSFAGVALLTQFHDVVIATGLYIFVGVFFPELKIDTFFITALLTILWYSINDTIVVFDRIRENIKKHLKTKKLDEIINISINETLARSIYTSLTLIFVLVTIFFFWPESLKWFMLAMILWVGFWTYSSIFVAAPILYEINKNKQLKVYEKKVVSDDDKIVV